MPGCVEYISHRDLEEDIAMTPRSHLRFLEDPLLALRARAAGAFRLSGSMASERSDADLDRDFDALRTEAKAGAEAKRGGLGA